MNVSKFGDITSLIANLGILLGLIFVGFEIRQNNEFLDAESRFNHAQVRADAARLQATNEDMAELRMKYVNGTELSDTESFRIMQYYRSTFVLWQWEYQEGIRGRIDMPVNAWRVSANFGNVRELWDQMKVSFTDEFVTFMESEIFE